MARNVWVLRGVPVVVSETADIRTPYRIGHPSAYIVQDVLSQIRNWPEGKTMVLTVGQLKRRQPRIAVERLRETRVVWGQYVGHYEPKVQLSPFVIVRGGMTSSFTVEVVGGFDRPMLVRAYPGEYMPPLPWQLSAGDAMGGKEACMEYWRTHAYVHSTSLVRAGTGTDKAPDWFTSRRS